MSATSIYDLHAASFSSVSAYVVMDGAERIATVAFKFPKDGAGRVLAYVHWMGLPMVRGFAAGGGYDKQSAAVAHAASKLATLLDDTKYSDGTPHHTLAEKLLYGKFIVATRADDGMRWDARLRDMGFNVLQAV